MIFFPVDIIVTIITNHRVLIMALLWLISVLNNECFHDDKKELQFSDRQRIKRKQKSGNRNRLLVKRIQWTLEL